jgi:hypothetical protein
MSTWQRAKQMISDSHVPSVIISTTDLLNLWNGIGVELHQWPRWHLFLRRLARFGRNQCRLFFSFGHSFK